jgi:hypothetical protein
LNVKVFINADDWGDFSGGQKEKTNEEL